MARVLYHTFITINHDLRALIAVKHPHTAGLFARANVFECSFYAAAPSECHTHANALYRFSLSLSRYMCGGLSIERGLISPWGQLLSLSMRDKQARDLHACDALIRSRHPQERISLELIRL